MAAYTAARSATSSPSGITELPKVWVRAARLLTLRAVAATLSPRFSAASAHTRPKPREVPVINQIFSDIRIVSQVGTHICIALDHQDRRRGQVAAHGLHRRTFVKPPLGQEHRRSYGAPALQVAMRSGRVAERHALADMRLDLP